VLGNNLTVPLDSSVLYIRPLYVTNSTNPMPQLRYVIAVFNQDVSIEPTLAGALSAVLGANVSGITPPPTTTTPGKTNATATADLAQAATDYTNAQAALSKGDLGLYQRDVEAMNQEITAAQAALAKK
jgi:hypothetical protein